MKQYYRLWNGKPGDILPKGAQFEFGETWKDSECIGLPFKTTDTYRIPCSPDPDNIGEGWELCEKGAEGHKESRYKNQTDEEWSSWELIRSWTYQTPHRYQHRRRLMCEEVPDAVEKPVEKKDPMEEADKIEASGLLPGESNMLKEIVCKCQSMGWTYKVSDADRHFLIQIPTQPEPHEQLAKEIEKAIMDSYSDRTMQQVIAEKLKGRVK